ncbi:hypothetical protein SmJEL517_g01381 [Synchytrium microbalum]|uniref:Very long-chain fatty acid transport protein n=1 Tax=Synchytrium microbalum TaxID=1806994 RepID=A0A507CBI0_9FUNG|nr:uncharacterized protein SmJEL517_g01381 [Synchytrium microbalum]TPX36688.1 hypothetical protein SmJEL517_g01381 [Synchytrium microbalum]
MSFLNPLPPNTSPSQAPLLLPPPVPPVKINKANPKTDPIQFLDNALGLSSDLDSIVRAIPAQQTAAKFVAAGKGNYMTMFDETVARYPEKEAFIYAETGATWTYKQLDTDANKMGHWLLEMDVRPGEIIPLMVENSPEYVIAWLAILKVGGVVACINHNLRSNALLHCLKVATGKMILFQDELGDAIRPLINDLPGVECLRLGETPLVWCEGISLSELADFPTDPIDKALQESRTLADLAEFIYTSGTTGLPKAVNITHAKLFAASCSTAVTGRYRPTDRIYTGMPLFHSAAGVMAMASGFMMGMTVIVARKFSASRFFKDCRKYNATFIQYIGEVARYLLSTPPSEDDRAHNIRGAIGNGLRSDIWQQFRNRFNIREIHEFFAATESVGGVSNYNVDETGIGSIGRVGTLQKTLSTARIVKFDFENDVPIRGPDGFCIEADYDEPGEFLTQIDETKGRAFYGYYQNEKGTNSKVLEDAFTKGDRWYRSGDIIKWDREGFCYFMDRIGDTFRWKGENVSTNEVGEAITTYPNVKEANVYGAAVPGKDGRAGMAAITAEPGFDISGLGKHVSDRLPNYALPIWIRILEEVAVTATFKHQKTTLRNEGMDITKFKDVTYMFNFETKNYEIFDKKKYDEVVSGKAKL